MLQEKAVMANSDLFLLLWSPFLVYSFVFPHASHFFPFHSMNTRLLASFITGSIILTGPVSAFAAAAETKAATTTKAASTTEITEEDLMNAIDSAPAPAMMDGRGGMSMPY